MFFSLCYSLDFDAIVVVLKIPRHLALKTMQNWVVVQDFYFEINSVSRSGGLISV